MLLASCQQKGHLVSRTRVFAPIPRPRVALSHGADVGLISPPGVRIGLAVSRGLLRPLAGLVVVRFQRMRSAQEACVRHMKHAIDP